MTMDDTRPLRSTRRLQNATSTLPKWYSISNLADGGPTMVTIYDEIGFFGVSAGSFMADIDGISGDIEMHINSPGGDVYDGITIYNRLKARKGNIHVVIDGLAASAASFIAMAASPGELEMAPRSEMMIHNGFTMTIGDAADHRKTADLLDRKTADIASIYAERSGKPPEYWLAQMTEETWLTAEQAVAEGLADNIQGQKPPKNKWDLSVYAKFADWPVVDETGEPPSRKCANCGTYGGPDAAECPSCGVPFDPDGDGDDDSTAAGDTDHDYVLPDGSPGPKARLRNAEKYNADDRKRLASEGHAMPDGSYPIADAEDLDNAIHAVGRGGSDHDAIRRHIIKRADALGLSSKIPDNWAADGSLKEPSAENHIDPALSGAASKTAGEDPFPDEWISNIQAALKEAQYQ